jgi:hypothetical protein
MDYKPNIVCVMAIFKRPEITIETVELLKKQEYPLHKIVLVGSCNIDREVAEKTNVEYLHRSNTPLGNKWQAGIEFSRKFKPDAILINGSDSWLTTNWCLKSIQFLRQGYDLIGSTKFYTCNANSNKKIKIIYRTYKDRIDPVGAGRIISKKVLEKMNWKWFPIGQNRSLDIASFRNMTHKVPDSKIKYINNIEGLIVMDIKSKKWFTINSFEAIKRSTKNFKEIGKINQPEDFLRKNFPDSFEQLEKIVPNVII